MPSLAFVSNVFSRALVNETAARCTPGNLFNILNRFVLKALLYVKNVWSRNERMRLDRLVNPLIN